MTLWVRAHLGFAHMGLAYIWAWPIQFVYGLGPYVPGPGPMPGPGPGPGARALPNGRQPSETNSFYKKYISFIVFFMCFRCVCICCFLSCYVFLLCVWFYVIFSVFLHVCALCVFLCV